MWIPVWAAGVVNGIGHWWGYRNFETADKSANVMPLGIWIGGEELHNNHHAFPGSAKFSVRRFEFDLGWFVIQALSRLGLAEVKRIAVIEQANMTNHLAIRMAQPVTLAPRVKVMTEFFRKVTLPVVREEVRRGDRHTPPVSIRLRHALADGGRWLSTDERKRLDAWIDTRPRLRTICRFRAQLAALMESRRADHVAESMMQWVRAAGTSGIDALQGFALSMEANMAMPGLQAGAADAAFPSIHCPTPTGDAAVRQLRDPHV
jgi:stearoyl-CoA desaturase (delta-9 desaturase)